MSSVLPRKGKKFIQRLKPAVYDFDEYSIVSSQVMISVSLISVA